jgi:hypothetical protein
MTDSGRIFNEYLNNDNSPGKYFGQVIFTEEPGNAVLDLKYKKF